MLSIILSFWLSITCNLINANIKPRTRFLLSSNVQLLPNLNYFIHQARSTALESLFDFKGYPSTYLFQQQTGDQTTYSWNTKFVYLSPIPTNPLFEVYSDDLHTNTLIKFNKNIINNTTLTHSMVINQIWMSGCFRYLSNFPELTPRTLFFGGDTNIIPELFANPEQSIRSVDFCHQSVWELPQFTGDKNKLRQALDYCLTNMVYPGCEVLIYDKIPLQYIDGYYFVSADMRAREFDLMTIEWIPFGLEITLTIKSVKGAAKEVDFSLPISRDVTLHQIKQIIRQKTGIEIAKQRLFAGGRLLENDDTRLSGSGVIMGSKAVIILIVRNRSKQQHQDISLIGDSNIELTVKNMKGDIILSESVDEKSTIKTIKEQIHRKKGIAVANQRLAASEKMLNDAESLLDSGVIQGNQATLALVVRLENTHQKKFVEY